MTTAPRKLAQVIVDALAYRAPETLTADAREVLIMARALVEIDPQRLRSIANLLTRSPYVGAASMVNDLRRYAAILDGSAPPTVVEETTT